MISKRKFGEIPDSVKGEPINLQNYDLKAEWFGAKIKMWNDVWPYLSHDATTPSTADGEAWDRYFLEHLGGYPRSYRLYRDSYMHFYNVPEKRPELFDTSYSPSRQTWATT